LSAPRWTSRGRSAGASCPRRRWCKRSGSSPASNLYGRTSSPYDTRRTAGGSSGGEGAAVGSGGSPFGVASDIAGSIRIPALFCGVFGHKPSSGAVPNTGLYRPHTRRATTQSDARPPVAGDARSDVQPRGDAGYRDPARALRARAAARRSDRGRARPRPRFDRGRARTRARVRRVGCAGGLTAP
jgi:Amidase